MFNPSKKVKEAKDRQEDNKTASFKNAISYSNKTTKCAVNPTWHIFSIPTKYVYQTRRPLANNPSKGSLYIAEGLVDASSANRMIVSELMCACGETVRMMSDSEVVS